jgi:hypothetical protein
MQFSVPIHPHLNGTVALYQVSGRLAPAADSRIGWGQHGEQLLQNLPCLLRFRLVPALKRLCRASWRGNRASPGQLDRDHGVSRENFRGVEDPSGLGRLGHAGPCALPAGHRTIALFYAWWSISVRLVEPDRPMEAITSRPLLSHAIATRGGIRDKQRSPKRVQRRGRFRPRRRFALAPFFAANG